MSILCDCHNHILNPEIEDSIYNTYNVFGIKTLYRVNSRYKSIGIHPLYIDEDIDWLEIEGLLKVDKKLFIGEVGLDRRGDLDPQIKVFTSFIELANRYTRPISVHCVKSWGKVLEVVQNLNPVIPVLFHGYSGSRETAKSLLKLNSFFSFSERELSREKSVEVIKMIPVYNILVESDLENDDYLTIGYKDYLKQLDKAYDKLSEIKAISRTEFNSIIKANFFRFISGGINEDSLFCT